MAKLTGNRVFLRPIMHEDVSWFRAIELSQEDIVLFRHRGTTPPLEEYLHTLSASVTCQFIVSTIEDNQRVGLVNSYNSDFRSGTTYVGVMYAPEFRRHGWPLEGVELFFDYLFETFPFRKLYAETLAPNLAQFQSAAGQLWKEEGRLEAHERIGDDHVDKLTLALYRQNWARWRTEGGESQSLVNKLRETEQLKSRGAS
jgi:RimJ/RimL family protein N-acetyltransferase